MVHPIVLGAGRRLFDDANGRIPLTLVDSITTTTGEPALRAVDPLDLQEHHIFHAIRADLLRRLNRTEEAADANRRAFDRTDNPAERSRLQHRLDHL